MHSVDVQGHVVKFFNRTHRYVGAPDSAAGSAGNPCSRGVGIAHQPRYCCEGSFACGAPDVGRTAQGVRHGSEANVRSVEEGLAAQRVEGHTSDSGGLDGAKQSGGARMPHSIACSRVNDNFCDCEDGSDEAGTSACSHLVRKPVAWLLAYFTPTTKQAPSLRALYGAVTGVSLADRSTCIAILGRTCGRGRNFATAEWVWDRRIPFTTAGPARCTSTVCRHQSGFCR